MDLESIVNDIVEFLDYGDDLNPDKMTKYKDDGQIIMQICIRLNYIKHRYELAKKSGADENKLDKFVLRCLEIWPGFMVTKDIVNVEGDAN